MTKRNEIERSPRVSYAKSCGAKLRGLVFIDKSVLLIADELAVSRYAKEGSCSAPAFRFGGFHRVGIVPVMSLLDGGAAGDSCREICLECGRVFKERWFVLKNQPAKIGDAA